MADVTGRTAFITGGANGIGLGIARALADEGVKIGLADVDQVALARASENLSSITEVHAVVLDVRDRDAYALAADTVEAKLGPVSLLFNNAGVAGGGPATALTYELWDWSLGINLGGVVNGVQTFLPRMLKRGEGGHIVNTASAAGLAATSSGVLYCTSKFAVVGMSETLRLELQEAGIGVSVLCPGPVATDIHARSTDINPGFAAMTADERNKITGRNAQVRAILQKGTSPDEVGLMVLDAIRDNQLYIHTDRIAVPLIERRHSELLRSLSSSNIKDVAPEVLAAFTASPQEVQD